MSTHFLFLCGDSESDDVHDGDDDDMTAMIW